MYRGRTPILKQTSEQKLVHHFFLVSIEWLEKYIELTGYYSDWEKRKRIRENDKIINPVGSQEEIERHLPDVLFNLYKAFKDIPNFQNIIGG